MRHGTHLSIPSLSIHCLFVLCSVGGIVAPVTPVLADGPTTMPTATAAGTWKWIFNFGTMQIPGAAILTQDGNDVHGKVTTGDGAATEITNGKVQNGTVTFTVTTQPGDQGPFINVYNGRASGDKIDGKVEMWWVEQPGQPHSTIDWNATRSK